jgi:eukaryotic-like serine/threonine-protein kinase
MPGCFPGIRNTDASMNDPEIDEVLFEAAESMGTPESRHAFFELIRHGDPSRSERLRGLLEVHGRADRFFRKAEGALTVVATEAGEELIDHEGLPGPAGEAADASPGECIGRYRLEKRIGEGGCGVVYLAEQLEPVRRHVALKVIRLGMDTERVIARFEKERQSLALMDHPNIARVLDGGATETGRPFFVMEWVRGLRITEYCEEKRLDLRERIDLFIEVCKGIQHAHQKGVIHRDIKPSNILVSGENGKPVPKVIDFGVAKAISSDPETAATVTSHDQFVGTPAYMSPEQADRKDWDIDTRSDVYSLGILLYELLVGRTPFDPALLAQAGLTEMRRILVEQDPPSPAATLAAMGEEELRRIATRRNTDPAKLVAVLKGDLSSVLMKAIEKDRQQRYETVNGLAMDLQRYLSHEPVVARPQKRLYLIRKFVRRNRVAVGAGVGIFVSLLFGLGTASTYYLREREARQEQMRLSQFAERAHQSELKRFAEARDWENFAHVSLLLSEGKTQEADEQLRQTPLSSIRLTPPSASVLRSLGNWNALRGRWQQASECFRILIKADEVYLTERLTSSFDLVSICCVWIEAGQPGDYTAFCDWAVDRFGAEASVLDASRLLHSVLLVPSSPDLLDRLEPLKAGLASSDFNEEKIKDRDREAAVWRAFGLALLEYRQGNHEQALHWSQVAYSFKATRDYINGALDPVYAMVSFRLGDVKTAEATLEKMRKRIDKAFSPELPAAYEPFGQYQGYWWDWIIVRILFREAEALIEGGGGR